MSLLKVVIIVGPYAWVKRKFYDPPDYRRQILLALSGAPTTGWNSSAIAQVAGIPIRDVAVSLFRIETAGYVVATTQPGENDKLQNFYQITVKGIEALWSDLGE